MDVFCRLTRHSIYFRRLRQAGQRRSLYSAVLSPVVIAAAAVSAAALTFAVADANQNHPPMQTIPTLT